MAKSRVILPEDLVIQVLSFFPVKSLMRTKCVCKSWKTLIANDPIFIKMHLKKLSTRNTHFALLDKDKNSKVSSFISIPMSCLLDDKLIMCRIRRCDPNFPFDSKDNFNWIVGSCNGLICLCGYSFFSNYEEHSLCFWNPATRTKSEKNLGFFRSYQKPRNIHHKFSFGYDNSTDTYKVVLLISKRKDYDGTNLVRPVGRVFTLGDNVWRDIIDRFLVTTTFYPDYLVDNNGVYLSNSINWLAYLHYDLLKNPTGKEFGIVSLDLGTETYSQLLLPQCCNEEPLHHPFLSVLMDCLCFSYDFKKSHFVIWQMKEFGVQPSWTQFIKISYDLNRQIGYCYQLNPVCLVGDTLILATSFGTETIVYDRRNNRERTITSINRIPWNNAKEYVQSLVSPCGK